MATMGSVELGGVRVSDGARRIPLKLILIDDHAILRDGLRALFNLQSDLEVIGEAGTIAEGIAVSMRLQPDAVIIDVLYPIGSGIDAIPLLRAACERTRIIVLTVSGTPECLCAARDAGADAFVAKHDAYEVLLAAIRSSTSLNEGHAHLPPSASDPGLSAKGLHAALIRRLTPRERQVLIEVARGNTSKQIAAKLNRGTKTIIKHRANMMRKLSLHDASAVTRFAFESGLLSAEREEDGE
jgi:DNA-binding NarL/FixJ family response regulator